MSDVALMFTNKRSGNMEPLREIVIIKEELNESDFEDETYEDDLIEEETDIEDFKEEYDDDEKIKLSMELESGFSVITSESSQGSSSAFAKRSDGVLNDELLRDLPVCALNQRLKCFTKEDIAMLKKKRRTLKNRNYARTSRKKRVTRIEELEAANRALKEELRRTRKERDEARGERDEARGERDSLREKYEPGERGYDPNDDVVQVYSDESSGEMLARKRRRNGKKWVSEIRLKMNELRSEMIKLEGDEMRNLGEMKSSVNRAC